MSIKNNITIEVELGDDRVPKDIRWTASEMEGDSEQDAKAMFLSLWDDDDAVSQIIALWTHDMKIDDMDAFLFQSLMSLGDAYERATKNERIAKGVKTFAQDLGKELGLLH